MSRSALKFILALSITLNLVFGTVAVWTGLTVRAYKRKADAAIAQVEAVKKAAEQTRLYKQGAEAGKVLLERIKNRTKE